MKFKTRLRVTFITIIFLPLLLIVLVFCVIGLYLMNNSQGNKLQDLDVTMMAEPIQAFIGTADDIYGQLCEQADTDVRLLEDREYLEKMNSSLRQRSAYLLVRRGNEIYYTGNEEAAQKIFDRLPRFGEGDLEEDASYYFNELNKYVKQIDFYFQDGTEGSLFVVMKINSLISRQLLIDMMIAIVLILIFTSLMLTQWIHKGVLHQ